MNEGLIPRRYAKALYKVAVERNLTRQVYDLMLRLEASFVACPALSEVLNNPFQSTDDKLSLLRTAAGIKADSRDKGDALLNDFMSLLVENRRLGMSRLIVCAFIGIYRQSNNIKLVHLTSAAKLSDKDLLRLRSLIEKHLGGATMEFSSDIDPELIGGFTVTVDNERLDASVSNELKQLRLTLLSKQAI